MGRTQETLSLHPVQWNGDVERLLSLAFVHNSDPYFGLDDLEDGAVRGAIQLVEVRDGLDPVAAIALRLDRSAKGNEMVILAAGGRLAGVNLTATVMPSLEAIAMACGAQSLRVHSSRGGMARHLRSLGFFEAERVYRKGLGDGRRKV